MTQIKKYNFSESEISFITIDETSGQFLWVGFKSDGSNCSLQKVSAHNPLQSYFDIDLSVTEMVNGKILSSYIYLALNDDTLIGRRYSIGNPLNTPTDFDIPSGIVEAPVDLVIKSTSVYFLLPGSISGQNAKICIFTTSGTFSETIDLTGITNASALVIDDNNDLWVVNYENPVKLCRIYDDGGWQITITTL